jgi:hypothetical protein
LSQPRRSHLSRLHNHIRPRSPVTACRLPFDLPLSHPPELCPLFSSYYIRRIIFISKRDTRISPGRQFYAEERASQYDVFFRRGWRNLRFSAKHPSDICPLKSTIPTDSRPDYTSYFVPVGGNYSDNRVIRIAHPVCAGGTCPS